MFLSFFSQWNPKSPAPGRKSTFRPQLESLEDRTVLSPLLTGGVQETGRSDAPAASGGVSLGGAVQVASTAFQGGVETTVTNPYGPYTNTNLGTLNQSNAWIVLVGQPLGSAQQPLTVNSMSAAGVSPGEFKVEIDWGNGTSTGQATQSGSEIQFQAPSHVWNEVGVYDITVHVQDTRWGNQWEYVDKVYVQPIPVTPSTPPSPTKPPAPPPNPAPQPPQTNPIPQGNALFNLVLTNEVLPAEGGYVNNPNDPGGATNHGITQRTLNGWTDAHGMPRQDVRTITPQEVAQIYYDSYWVPSGAANLPPGIGALQFDTAVNMGLGGANRIWQQVQQQAAAQHISTTVDSAALRQLYLQVRQNRYNQIIQRHPRLAVFRQGWTNRLNNLGRFVNNNIPLPQAEEVYGQVLPRQ